MNIINIEIQEWTTVLFKFNWLAIVIILALIWILSFLMDLMKKRSLLARIVL